MKYRLALFALLGWAALALAEPTPGNPLFATTFNDLAGQPQALRVRRGVVHRAGIGDPCVFHAAASATRGFSSAPMPSI